MITVWESLDAIRSFAGGDHERAVFYEDDDAYLVDREWTVRHYDVYGSQRGACDLRRRMPALGPPAWRSGAC